MTVQDALLILDLSAPITREMLSSAYEEGVQVWNPKNFEGRVSLLAKAAAKTEQLFMAHDLLSRQPDDAFPFQGGVSKPRMGAVGLTRPGAAPMAAADAAPLPPPQSSLPPPQPLPTPEPQLQPLAMGMEMPQAEGEPQARPMPRAMKPRPRQMSEMAPLEMSPQAEPLMHESVSHDTVAAAAYDSPAEPAEVVMSSEVQAEARTMPLQPPPMPTSAPSGRPQVMAPLHTAPRVPKETRREAAAFQPMPEHVPMELPEEHAPMESRQALPPLPLEAVQGQPELSQEVAMPGGRPAPFLYRAGAWLFDLIIFAVFATVIGTGNVSENAGGPGGGVSLVGIVKLIACGIFSLLYYVVLESSPTQGTLGKKACGLVVTDMQGRRISVGRATGRFFARLLCWPLTVGIGYLMAAFTRQRQGLHDMVAGCLVRRGAAVSAGVVAGEVKKERTPTILIILGLGVTAAVALVGYTYWMSNSDVSLPAAGPSVTAAPAPAPVVAPRPAAPAGTGANSAPNANTGTGMPPETKVLEWRKGLPIADVQALAARGDVKAQEELAFAYAAGSGVPKSLTTAAEWMRKAAETGDGFAQYHMGYAYRMGEGVAKDDAEAARWYRKAAEQGVALAQVDLACAYFTGEGVEKDDTASVMWMRKAAEQGNREALDSLGSAYQYGVGVAKDLQEAVRWYQKAAALAYPLGRFHLGACYEDGQGVAQDLAEALKWYILTDANGDQGIIDARNALEGRMSVQDRAEALRRAKEVADEASKK